jgi:hypothetical protein
LGRAVQPNLRGTESEECLNYCVICIFEDYDFFDVQTISLVILGF